MLTHFSKCDPFSELLSGLHVTFCEMANPRTSAIVKLSGLWTVEYGEKIVLQHGRHMGLDPRGTPIWNRRGCSSEILNLTWLKLFVTPKGDQSGRGLSKF